jgi:hypothetical protein
MVKLPADGSINRKKKKHISQKVVKWDELTITLCDGHFALDSCSLNYCEVSMNDSLHGQQDQ